MVDSPLITGFYSSHSSHYDHFDEDSSKSENHNYALIGSLNAEASMHETKVPE